ncbi:MAG: dihydrolipoyl dehydrogenase [Proteobacteria bacterium]|nr:dihydrolipoyl dehydrogenase [Pseudomonadota bacterium]
MTQFDVIFVGGGPAGYTGAIRAGQLGLNVACVESRGTLGGTCLNVGCIPSKALLQSSEHMHHALHKAAEHGVKIGKVELDLAQMMKRKDGIVSGLTKGIEGLLKKNKVTYIKGKGTFVNSTTLSVINTDGKTEEHTAKNFVISTGSVPVDLRTVAAFDGKDIVSSTEALCFEQVPNHLVVIGGGVIGLEMGSVWLRLGAKVTVIEALDRVLPPMDAAVSAEMKKILEKQGMTFMLSSKLTKAEKSGPKINVTAEQSGKMVEISCDKLLVAVGRRAYTDGLGLEKVGITPRRDGKIDVDAHYKTNIANIFAVGDVIDGPMLAHKADEEGVAVAEIIAGKSGHVNYKAIPNVVYTWPEVASVGHTEEEVKAKGIEYKVGKIPFMANGRARCAGETDGFVKIIADAKTDLIIGAHIIGPNASELIAELVIGVEFSASAEDIARSSHAHPTLAEVMKEAALAVDKRSLNY